MMFEESYTQTFQHFVHFSGQQDTSQDLTEGVQVKQWKYGAATGSQQKDITMWTTLQEFEPPTNFLCNDYDSFFDSGILHELFDSFADAELQLGANFPEFPVLHIIHTVDHRKKKCQTNEKLQVSLTSFTLTFRRKCIYRHVGLSYKWLLV